MRDVGGLGVHLARAVAEGTVDGPAIYGAGAILSTTGGHGDLHAFPLDWIEDYARHGGMLRLADGPDECAKAVREQLRRNAKLIKVCASGGVLSEVDDPIHQQFTMTELRAIVEVAGLADRVVAAHCHGKPGIMAALRAGVRTIEHGTYLDDECCDAMRETGAILVPTRTIIEDMLANKAAVPAYAMAKLEAIADLHAQAVARACEQGVTIAMGTDIALSGSDLPNSWGQNGSEPGYLVKLGATPLEAIEAATAPGRSPWGRRRRAAGGSQGVRRRRDHPGRRSAGPPRRARRPCSRDRGLDRRTASQGLHAQREVDFVVSGMPYSPARGIWGFSCRDWSTAPGRSSASRNPRRL